MIMRKLFLISRYTVLLFMVFFLSQSNVMAQKNILKLYEPSSSVSLDSLHKVLVLHSFFPNQDSKDTLAEYSYGSEYVELGYCPKSKTIFSYSYKWEYSSILNDEFMPKTISHKPYLEQSKLYYTNILSYLKQKYSEPTFIVYHKSYNTAITYEKEKIDTLNIGNFFNEGCRFEIIWKNEERIIALEFHNYSIHSTINYTYLNYANQSKKNEESASIKNQNVIKSVVIGLIIILLLYAIFKFLSNRFKEKQVEHKERIAELSKQIQTKDKEREEKRKQTEEQMKQLEVNHKNYVDSLVVKYGNCDKNIKLNPKRPFGFNEILVFGQSKHIVIAKKEYNFSDILDCTVNDDIKEKETVQTFRGNSTATSKTNTGNMVGRAIVGGVLLGGAGAIIGGSTAKRNTVIEHGMDTSIHNKEVEHNYTVAITVKDISNPVLYLNVGSNTGLKDEIISLMKVVMSMR